MDLKRKISKVSPGYPKIQTETQHGSSI